MYEYLIIMAITVCLPLLIMWLWKYNTLKKYKLVFPLAILGTMIFGPIWDYIAVKENIWMFSSTRIIGIGFWGLPLEEWLFYMFWTLLFSTITVLLWNKYGVKK